MFTIDAYTPARVIFGAGRLKELGSVSLPGKKALICVTQDGLMEKLGIQKRVTDLLKENGTEYVIFDRVQPNPTQSGVMAAAALAGKENCDFVIGLGGGSSVDTAKATAIMMINPGVLWDYAQTGTGKNQPVSCAAPIVTISTTCGTGTETDPYCVITNEETKEKLDFALDQIFPALSIIDPELMCSLPHKLTLYQGFDALFHLAECYITNEHQNHLVDLYAVDGIKMVAHNLPLVAKDGNNLEARTCMCYAADILAGYTQALCSTTSHHNIAQTIGGQFPAVVHGESLLMIAESYYKKVKQLRPALLDELGEVCGVLRDGKDPGQGFVTALKQLMDVTGVRELYSMAEEGITEADFQTIADVTVDNTGIAFEKYEITKADIIQMLKDSYDSVR